MGVAPRPVSPLILIGACIVGGFLAVFVAVLMLRPDTNADVPGADSEPIVAASETRADTDSDSDRSDGAPMAAVEEVSSFSARTPTPEADVFAGQTASPANGSPLAMTSQPPTEPASPLVTAPDESPEPVTPQPETATPSGNSPVEPIPQELSNLPAPSKRPTARVNDEPDLELPPIPDEILPIKADRFGEIRKAISLERRARDAYALFEVFSQSFEFDENQKSQVDKELPTWKERAEQDLYRLGTRWVTKEAVEEAAVKAEGILQQADQALANRQFAQAVKLYEDASRVDPNNVRADYTLGLMYSLPFAGDYQVDKSLSHFTRVDTKSPNFAAAHNSLGITYSKQGKFTNAISHFEKAAELQMYCPEVIQNLGRMRHLADLLKVDARSLARCQQLYDKLLEEGKGEHFRADVGWLHMMPVFSSEERSLDLNQVANTSRGVAGSPMAMSDLTPSNFATAILIAPEYLLTSRHAVSSGSSGVADQIGIRDQRGQELSGTVVGLAKRADLALVYVPGLKGIPLRMSNTLVPSGTSLTAQVATPSNQLGPGRPGSTQSVQGGVSQAANPSLPGQREYGLTHLAGPQALGAPALNESGEVVAILTRRVNQFDYSVVGQLQGVTSVDAQQFIDENLGTIQGTSTPTPRMNLPTPANSMIHSVFPLTSYYRSSMRSLVQAADSSTAERQAPYEDYTCPVCNGRSVLPCTARGCVGGNLSESYLVPVQVQILDKTITRQEKRFRKVDCPSCVGGAVDCPHCINGHDNSLRRGRTATPGRNLLGR